MKVLMQRVNDSTGMIKSELTDLQKYLSETESEDLLEIDEEQEEFYVNETEDEYQLELYIPGFHKEDFIIQVNDNGVMTIEARDGSSSSAENDNTGDRSLDFESYSRSFILPQDADEQEIEAYYEDGILSIMILKC